MSKELEYVIDLFDNISAYSFIVVEDMKNKNNILVKRKSDNKLCCIFYKNEIKKIIEVENDKKRNISKNN